MHKSLPCPKASPKWPADSPEVNNPKVGELQDRPKPPLEAAQLQTGLEMVWESPQSQPRNSLGNREPKQLQTAPKCFVRAPKSIPEQPRNGLSPRAPKQPNPKPSKPPENSLELVWSQTDGLGVGDCSQEMVWETAKAELLLDKLKDKTQVKTELKLFGAQTL